MGQSNSSESTGKAQDTSAAPRVTSSEKPDSVSLTGSLDTARNFCMPLLLQQQLKVMRLSLLGVATLPFSVAFVLPGRVPSRGNAVLMSARSSELSRADALRVAGAGLLPIALMPFMGLAAPARAAGVVTLPSGLQYEIVKEGDGPTPNLGELAAIRFKGSYNGVVFDNLIDSKEPYYFRVGGGNLLKGIEEAVPLMKVGSTWKLTIPGDLAFGRKGRPASPGKPRIPSMATIDYELQLVSLPGREPELIDLQPFDEDAPASDDSAPTRLF